MGFRLKTSKLTMDIFEYLGNRMNLQPFILSKIAISLSIKEGSVQHLVQQDTSGLELNRQTIMGEYDSLYKALMEQAENKTLTDDEYFPDITKRHLDRGAKKLKDIYDYNKNYEKLFDFLLLEGDRL